LLSQEAEKKDLNDSKTPLLSESLETWTGELLEAASSVVCCDVLLVSPVKPYLSRDLEVVMCY